MSDSKGAAIDEIFEKAFPLHRLHPANDSNFAEAKQAILAILAQEVKRVIGEDEKIDEGDELVHDKFTRNDLRAETRRRANQ